MSPDPSSPASDTLLDAQVRAFLRSRTLVQAHVRTLVHDSSLAEDVFQEVWVRFEKATRHGEVIENVPAWCRAAARLVALESWRKLGRELPTPDDALTSLIDQSYAEQDGRDEEWERHGRALTLCLASLPPKAREIIQRRYRQNQGVAEIAAQLGQSSGSLKTALCRLRLALADCVRQRLESTHAA